MRCASFGTHLLCLLFTTTLFGYSPSVTAVPAPKNLVQIAQPDGTKLTVLKKGDEFFHYAVSSDGYTLKPDSLGFYRYAVRDDRGDLVPGPQVATDRTKRSAEAVRFLSTITPGMPFSERQRAVGTGRRIDNSLKRVPSLRSAGTVSMSDLLINTYPLSGKVRSLVILVSFSDNTFLINQPDSAFYRQLNQKGYTEGSHIGSVSDYYAFNSGGRFTPEFEVVGPVKLKNPVSYYGANDTDGNDVRPQEMVKEACQAISNLVDFSQFDNNGDGIVDNVYIFYAGKGEADGGDDNTIWPHSSSLPPRSLRLDGKWIENYGCSAELSGNNTMTGMGVFTHEYGHVIGLPDFYDVDSENNGDSFDLDAWSLMAYGSYNNHGCVPPSLTLLERYLLGWAQPTTLTVPASPNLPPLVNSNQGFLIPTNNDKEFFLLENRQQLSGTWDEFIPYHGMLVYHIDRRDNVTTPLNYYGTQKIYSYEQLWPINMVNAISTHQCADIEEADNSRVAFSGSNYPAYITGLKGDIYPGLYGIGSITDNTLPSMKGWDGSSTNKPISRITEKINSDVSFDFMGGKFEMPIPRAIEPRQVFPFSFEARWQAVEGASGYLLDVFTLDTSSGDSVKMYVPTYQNLQVLDTSYLVRVPNEQTAYHYQVKSTNGFKQSDLSTLISLTTGSSKPVVRQANDIRPFQFKANWEPAPWATGYYLSVFEIDSLPGGDTTMTVLPNFNHILTTDTSFLVDDANNERTYGYYLAATDGVATGINSDLMLVSTPCSSSVVVHVKNGYIHAKGIDPGSTITLYGLDGLIKQVSNEPDFVSVSPGLYIAEVQFRQKKRYIKVLVN